MKIIMLSLAVLSLFVFQQEKPKLKGKYRIEYDKNYGLQPFQITFNDSTYVKKMPDAVTTGGKITYEKYKVVIRKNNDENPIVIDSRELAKDTMKFTIKNKTDLSRNIHYGKMIRMKELPR